MVENYWTVVGWGFCAAEVFHGQAGGETVTIAIAWSCCAVHVTSVQ